MITTNDALGSVALSEAPAADGMVYEMAEALIERGLMTRAEVDASLAAEARGESTAPAETGRWAHIEESFRPPATPASYVLPKIDESHYSLELDRGIRNMAWDAGLDQGFVADLVSRGNKMALAPKKTEADVEMQRRNRDAELARAWGPNYEVNMAATKAFVGSIVAKHPTLQVMLDTNGLGDDPDVIRLWHTRALARKTLA